MDFSDANAVDQLCYQMRLSDYPRGQNRARINELMNGWPPYTDSEVTDNNIAVNVNFLEGTRVAHDARAQFYGAFLKPGRFFSATTDAGPAQKRRMREAVVNREMNRRMKKSIDYLECCRSEFALDVLHGVGPSCWENEDKWCPDGIGIEDVLIPAKTLLTLKNLPFIALYRSFTAPELIKLTRGPNVDSGWNRPLVERCIEWVDRETMTLMGSNWPEVWSPEKMSERIKGDGGFYVGDQVPTIDCFDFYFYDDTGKQSGIKRRIILDSWSTPAVYGKSDRFTRKTGDIFNDRDSGFLYTSGDNFFCDNFRNIISFQFADLSAVAPFQYHSVRGLGFLLYSVCHLQNRLRCKFTEGVFENLMMLFRIKTMDEAQRAMKVNLVHEGFIDETLEPVPANQRFQPNWNLVSGGLSENARLISESGSMFRTNPNIGQDKVEKTAFQVMAEVNAMTTLVSAALTQAYNYRVFQYREIFRRFMRKNSRDPDVQEFQAACIRQNVPQSMMVPEAWDLQTERVMGAGNKTLEMAIAQQLMNFRDKFDPEPQRQILRDVVLAITDDPGRSELLVPEQPVTVTDSVHDAQLAAGTLMQGMPVALKTGMNHIEYVETLLASMAMVIGRINQRGGMATLDEIIGLRNMEQHIGQHIGIIAQDQAEKQRVKQYGDQLGKLSNIIKAYAQRLQQQMAKGNGGAQSGPDPKDIAKAQATMMQAKIKAENTSRAHAQRTAQRQIQFEQQMQQSDQEHAQSMRQQLAEAALELKKNQLSMLHETSQD